MSISSAATQVQSAGFVKVAIEGFHPVAKGQYLSFKVSQSTMDIFVLLRLLRHLAQLLAPRRGQGLEGISARKFKLVALLGQVRTHWITDLVQRRWDAGTIDAIWITDMTYLRTGQGWLYLYAVRDGCSWRVIGWAMDSVQDTALVIKALRMATVLRQGPVRGRFPCRSRNAVHLGPDA